MPEILHQALTVSGLALAVAELCHLEPRFQGIVDRHGLPTLRQTAQGLDGLLQIVTEQFLSLRAADAIWRRLHHRLHPFDADAVLLCPVDELKSLGLSAAKARSFHGIAQAVQVGSFNPENLVQHSDDEARVNLLRLPGVGPWTADIYLLAALLRPDVWPWGDLALQVAAKDLFSLPLLPGKAAMIAVAEPFRPWRAVAARLLWSHYRGLRGLKQA